MKLKFLIFALLLFINTATGEEQKVGLEIAIAPFLPVKTHIKNYAPMRAYLEKNLGEPVTIISAPDYETYFRNIQERHYKLIITFAGSAYLAWSESGYIPLLKPRANTHPTLISAVDKPEPAVTALHGKRIAMADEINTTTIEGKEILKSLGYKNDELTLIYLPTQSAPVNYVLTGEADVAIVSDRSLMQLPADTISRVRTIKIWEQNGVPGIIYLAHPGLGKNHIKSITQAILDFTKNTAEGVKMMQDFGYKGLDQMDATDMKPLEIYGVSVQKTIAAKNQRKESAK